MEVSKNIISDELIISYINGSLPNDQKELLESVLLNDDNVFTRYAIFKKAHLDISNSQLEVTPDILKEKLISELGLSTGESENLDKEPGLLGWFDSLITSIFELQPRLAIISTALIALLTRYLFLADPVKAPSRLLYSDEPKHRKHISELYESLNNKSKSYQSVNARKKVGLAVSIKDDTLIIQQPLIVSRKIYVFNSEQSVLLEDVVKDKENNILLEKLSDQDSLRVMIETAGIIIYDDWLINIQ